MHNFELSECETQLCIYTPPRTNFSPLAYRSGSATAESENCQTATIDASTLQFDTPPIHPATDSRRTNCSVVIQYLEVVI